MKHQNPDCSYIEIGEWNCPKCFFDTNKNRICAKCGVEYSSYRDGYCEDCELNEDRELL